MQRIGTKEGHHEWRVVSHDVQRVRGNQAFFDRLNSPANWMTDAPCVGHFEEFDIPDILDGNPSGLYVRLHEAARKHCDFCPVKFRCGSEATAIDREWSVRGGQMPRALKRMV